MFKLLFRKKYFKKNIKYTLYLLRIGLGGTKVILAGPSVKKFIVEREVFLVPYKLFKCSKEVKHF